MVCVNVKGKCSENVSIVLKQLIHLAKKVFFVIFVELFQLRATPIYYLRSTRSQLPLTVQKMSIRYVIVFALTLV